MNCYHRKKTFLKAVRTSSSVSYSRFESIILRSLFPSVSLWTLFSGGIYLQDVVNFWPSNLVNIMPRNVTTVVSSGVVIITTNCAFQAIFLDSLVSSHAYVNEDASVFDKKKKQEQKQHLSSIWQCISNDKHVMKIDYWGRLLEMRNFISFFYHWSHNVLVGVRCLSL